jgi:signal transduction histidine kinase
MPSHHTLKRQPDVTPATTSAHPASVLEIVARITRGIVREWDADVVMRALVREASGMLGATAIMLWLTGATPDDVSELTLAYSHGLRPGGEPHIARCDLDAAGVVGRAAVASDLLVVMADDAASPTDPLAGYLQAQGLATMLLVPLEAHGRLLGVVGIGSANPQAFDTDESRRHARLLGDLCALAVESTGLQERLRTTNAQLVATSIEAQQRAEELAQEKQEREAFISLVAHELKNPLSVLTLQIALLQRGRPGAKRQETSLRIMAVKAAQLKRLIDDLLDASRIAVGHFSVEPEPTDVAALAREVVQEQQAATKVHRVRLDLEAAAFSCSCDRQRLAQALSNLVSNAIKYSPNGGDIVVRVERADGLVRVSVTDQGAGLSADDLAHLFEPYTRLLRVREALGAGLGLYITNGIAEAHGGSISATSPGVGHGSTFTLAIPCTGEPVPRV